MGKDAFSIISGSSLFPGFTELTLESKNSLRTFCGIIYCSVKGFIMRSFAQIIFEEFLDPLRCTFHRLSHMSETFTNSGIEWLL